MTTNYTYTNTNTNTNTTHSLGGAGNPMAGLFGPQMITKMKADPKLKEYLNDEEFMQKIDMLQKNPNNLQTMMGDPRIMEVFQMMLGGNVSFGR